jgi:hypothetical protein
MVEATGWREARVGERAVAGALDKNYYDHLLKSLKIMQINGLHRYFNTRVTRKARDQETAIAGTTTAVTTGANTTTAEPRERMNGGS